MERFNGHNFQFKDGLPVARDSAWDRFQPYPLPEDKVAAKAFYGGEGPSELVQSKNGRTEILHRHRSGFSEKPLKIMSFGAHPDDHALAAGFDHVLLKATNPGIDIKNAQAHEMESGLLVVTATAGQEGKNGDGITRVYEDKAGTRILGADGVHNLGFYDGELTRDQEELTERFVELLEEHDPNIVLAPSPDDYVHLDHIAVQKAVVEALKRTKKKPIVVYTDSQAGVGKPQDGADRSVGYRVEPEEDEVWIDAYEGHDSEMEELTKDIRDVKNRTAVRAIQMGVPGFAGVVRQDREFSQQPIEEFLGDRAIEIPLEDQPTNEIQTSSPVTIYTADRQSIFRTLPFTPVSQRQNLVAEPVLSAMDQSSFNELLVAEVNPDVAEGPAFFENYPIPKSGVAKLLVVRVDGDEEQHAAVVVPSNTRADLNGAIKSELNARRVSIAPRDFVQQRTGMEQGSMSPVGLPNEWPVFVDSRIITQASNGGIVIGSGLRRSKLYVSGSITDNLPNALVMDGLGK